MTITHDPDRRVVLGLHGEIDMATSPTIDDLVTAAIEAGFLEVTIDLGGVDFIDSYGFRTLLAAEGRLSDLGGSLALAAVHGRPRQLLHALGLEQRLPCR